MCIQLSGFMAAHCSLHGNNIH